MSVRPFILKTLKFKAQHHSFQRIFEVVRDGVSYMSHHLIVNYETVFNVCQCAPNIEEYSVIEITHDIVACNLPAFFGYL